ncbi:hypothetical protein CPB84DRAFT_1856165 [Gymnopilus junonius]|uniref:Uncharacterized protein n=1 Tax=Gymnopilus junonius TaxID=109634 RepID=A0A9P5TF60_GYMJU|nr:hypothetical protein CPB84DRAFT_1856165 [Gymnopilus junonius]
MSWNTDGPIPDLAKPWDLNLFPEITLLVNDTPDPLKQTFFTRFIKDQIDFGMVRNWLTACKNWHGSVCDKSKMLGDTVEDPSIEIPHFCLMDVTDKCIVLAPPDPKYIALSYIWGNIDVKTTLRLLKENAAQLAESGALLDPKYCDRIPLTILNVMQVSRN